MTEDEFHSLPFFDNLPVYSSINLRCQEVASISLFQSPYEGVVECNEYEDALKALKNDHFVPRGTIRYQIAFRDDPEFLVNYVVFFWRLQNDLLYS